MSQNVYLIVEHLEKDLPPWAELEYKHLVHHLINAHPGCLHVVFTNVFGESSAFPRMLEEIASEYDQVEKKSDTSGITLHFSAGKKSVSATSQQALPYVLNRCESRDTAVSNFVANVIILDPMAEGEVESPEALHRDPSKTCENDAKDGKHFYIFGGILGDHPMNGRTYKELTKGFVDFQKEHITSPFTLRSAHLGKLQMTTDTALLVTAAVVLGAERLNALQYIDEPKFRMSAVERIKMRGFRYLDASHNWHDERFSESLSGALLPKGMTSLLKEDYTWE